jgi:ubiquinone/menaquinone biosynthesis C-methylase UbiE
MTYPSSAEARFERFSQYTLDGSDPDLRRLLGIAELMSDATRTALRRVNVQAGWRAIECGCGPVGGLAVMAEMVGHAGQVVGVDFNAPAVERAREVIGALGIGNVEVLVGDVNELDAAALGGPFDFAYTRCFLMHQVNPAATLSRIAALVRPGGWIVCQEPLRAPAPSASQDLDALNTYWDLLHQVVESAGVPTGTVERLAHTAHQAGLELHEAHGFFNVMNPELGFELHAATLSAIGKRATQAGIATTEQIEALDAELRDSTDGSYEWVTSPFFLDLAFRKPLATGFGAR